MSAQKPEEYGMVVYDVPSDNQKLYYRIWTKIRKYGIRINLSVYLIPWGYKKLCENLLNEAMAETGQNATFSIMKFDGFSQDTVETLAVEQLNREVHDTMTRLHEKAEEYIINGKDLPQRYLNTVKGRLDTAKALAVVFGITGDVEMSIQAACDIFNVHLEALQEQKRKAKNTEVVETIEDTNEQYGEEEVEATEVTEAVEVAETEPVRDSVTEDIDTIVPVTYRNEGRSQGNVMPVGAELFIRNVMNQGT